ncbi:proton myo-inositol cotransporter-like [Amphiura filiformis]|uniref:proton myo-inositol cotransporter-like n=1 Tax=Amphiura filiformis TaxID=82378 RepID=UPI003B221298
MYIGESSPPRWRGALVQMVNICVAGGTMAASIVNGIFSYYPWGWRAMLGLASIPGIIQFIGFWFLPESPRWLVKHGRIEKAKETLKRLVGEAETEREFDEIVKVEKMQQRIRQEMNGASVISRVFSTPPVLRAAIVGCGIQIINQLAGINVIVPYSAMIMRMSGIQSDQAVMWMVVAVSGLFVVGQLITLCTVGRFGRRKIFLSHLAVVILALIFLAISFYLMSISAPPVTYHNMLAGSCGQINQCTSCILEEHCGFCYIQQNDSFVPGSGSCLPLDVNDVQHSTIGRCSKQNITDNIVWAYDFCPNPYGIMALVGMMVYILPFAAGVGPIIWIITPELYPTWARGFGTSSATAVGWITNLLISLTFLSLTQAITRYGTFLVYAGCTVFGWIFIYYLVPETKDKHLEEVEKLFEEPFSTCCGKPLGGIYQKLDNSDEDEILPVSDEDD